MEQKTVNEFNPSWINVINKSMMECYNNFPPGFMCVGRKPHPFVNQRRIICHGLTSILWRTHIVEKNNIPTQLGPKLHSELGRTVGTMIWMYQPIFLTVKYFVMESVFFVANGNFALETKGVQVYHQLTFCRHRGGVCRHIVGCHRRQYIIKYLLIQRD